MEELKDYVKEQLDICSVSAIVALLDVELSPPGKEAFSEGDRRELLGRGDAFQEVLNKIQELGL